MSARSAAIAHLERLVGWPTVSSRPVTALAAWLAERAEGAGFTVERFDVTEGKLNLICRRGPRRDDRSRGLVLSGHMDVVPVEGQDWTTDPFRLTERDGRLLGRGAADMKGFIAATVAACDALRDVPLDDELVLVWTCDEEVGCVGSADLVSKLQGSDAHPLPRPTLIGEPTDFRALRLHPGHTTWRVRCQGRPAHSSRPTLGLSAIKLATRVLLAIEALEEELAAERRFEGDLPSPWTVLHAGVVRGGAAVNIVPDRCEVLIGARPLPGDSLEALTARIAALLDPIDAAARDRGGAVHLDVVQSCPPLLTPEGCAHQHLLTPWLSDPRPTGAPFATDGGPLSMLGCEPLIFGPGSIDVAHRPDEYIHGRDLLRAVDAITDIVQRACAPTR